MANLQRGFRRIAWVLVAIGVPVVGAFTYEVSETLSGYEATLITERFPDPNETSPLKRAVHVADVGIFYLPSYLSKAEIDKQMPILVRKAAALRLPDTGKRRSIGDFAKSVHSKYPEYADMDDITLTKRVLTKFPVYRDTVNFREYEVVPVYAKRPFWATAVTVLIVGLIAALLHCSISVLGWIARGFKSGA